MSVYSCTVYDRHYGHVRNLVSYGVYVYGTHSLAQQLCHIVAVVHSLIRCVLSEMTTYSLPPAISH